MKALVSFLLVIALPAMTNNSIEARTWEVPSYLQHVSTAMDSASAGDLVQVNWADWTDTTVAYSDTFTVKSGVQVKAKPGTRPIIDGGSLRSSTVDFESGASSSTLLEGFVIKGGTDEVVRVRGSGVVRNCTIENTNAGTNYNGIVSGGSTTIDSTTVTLSGDGGLTGIWHTGGPPNITHCTVHVTAQVSGTGIYVKAPSATTTGSISGTSVTVNKGDGLHLWDGSYTVSGVTVAVTDGDENSTGVSCGYSSANNTRCTVTDCLIKAPGAYGVAIYEDSVKVNHVTVDSVLTGIWAHSSLSAPEVDHCIVTNFYDGIGGYAFYNVDAVYCIADGSYPYGPGSQGTGSVNEDPLYCDAANGEYTLRVDSYGNPENNASGKRIGAFPVVCMYGTLARSAAFAGNGTLDMTATTTIPSGDSLTLKAGTTLTVAKGSTTKLTVNGTLHVDGTASNRVVFRSAEATPLEGDWHSITVGSGARAVLEYADIEHSTYGVYLQGPDSAQVIHCNFSANSNHDIGVYNVNSSRYALVDQNSLTVNGGNGIVLYGDCGGLTVSSNQITGNTATSNGIRTDYGFTGSPAVTGNTISGLVNGSCVYVDAGSPTFTQNTFRDSKYGLLVKGGTVSIGTTNSSSDNFIHDNTNGIRCDGGCPTVRNNRITANTNGIYAFNNGLPDVGNPNQNGNNSIYNNTSHCVVNRNFTALQANGNWWGSCAAPTCTSGSVLTGGWLCSQPAACDQPITAVAGDAARLRILGARPNPTRGASVIAFALGKGPARIAVQVFDVAGRAVRRLAPREVPAGRHEIYWNGRDDAGRPVRDGIYFVRVQANDNLQATTKVLVVR